ncbi:aspartate/glutamate racemase family protein [Thermodesulfobacteriota bacterium]
MKTIGLIGGMSWASSIEYYRIINEETRAKCGGLHSAKSIMYSVDFAEIEHLQHEGKWDQIAQVLTAAAKNLEKCGADFILICTNTMHKLADQIQIHIEIPLLHIADATAKKIKVRGIKSVLLLGTQFTMEEDFYRGRLERNYGLEVIIPPAEEREIVHGVIYNELCMGTIKPASKKAYMSIIERMVREGAEGVILGCTEIGLLVKKEDSPVPVFDTAKIHAIAAVEYALTPPAGKRE